MPHAASLPRVSLVLALALGAGCAHARAATPGQPAVSTVEHRVGGDGDAEIAQLERSFERAALVIGPSVVAITSEREADVGQIPAFLRPFGPPDGTVRGLGSGVIIDASGYILTNNHVVDGAQRLRVRLHDDREFDAEVVGADAKTDVAVIRIEADGLVPAATTSSEGVRVGQWVMAAGSPFGLTKSVSAGIISAVGRGAMGIADYGDFLQTDAAVNQGNSGGPLIDLRGRVIGINTAIASQGGGSNGVGFAIPIDLAKGIMRQLIDHGSVERGWLGIVMGRLTPEMAASFGLKDRGGVLVDDVDPKGPAAAAGLRAGDIVLSLDGKKLDDMGALRNRVASKRPGTKVDLTIWRGDATKTLGFELGALPGQDDARPAGKRERSKASKPKPKAKQELGLAFADIDGELRQRFNLGPTIKGALVTQVAPRSVASAELAPGDVLVDVAGKPVRSATEATRLLAKVDLDAGVRVRVMRGGFGHFVLLHRRP